MNRSVRYLVAILAAAMPAGCVVKDAIRQADAEIVRFHADLDAGNMRIIWDMTGADMRRATTQDKFIAMLDSVHRKLGKVKSSRKIAWNSDTGTRGNFMTITNETVFQRGTATEQFLFREKVADELALVGYHIKSDEMMVD